MSRIVSLFGLAMLASISASPASAEILDFTLAGSQQATFELNSANPSSFSSSSLIGNQVAYTSVSGSFGGTPGVASTISFGTGSILAQLNIDGTALGFTQLSGPDLFTGNPADPTFNIGTFDLANPFMSQNDVLTISVAAVPEPSTWAMMILGFLGLGFLAYRKKATLRLV